VHALLDPDPEVVAAAARSLAAEIPSLSSGRRRGLTDHLLDYLKKKRKPPLPAASEAAMIRVLAALHEPQAEEILWSRLDRSQPPAIRASALQALGALPPRKRESRLERLIEAACDPEFQVAAPALLLLKEAPVTAKTVSPWLRLLDAADPATRRFAVEKLGSLDEPRVATRVVAQLRHPDRSLRDLAVQALSGTAQGRKALVQALIEAETADDAWRLARAQAPSCKDMPKPLRVRLFEAACDYRDADDRRSEPLFFLLREADAAWTRDQIQAKALALRKKKNYTGAVAYLRMLARDAACGEQTRFELAATGLKTSTRDLAPEARQADHSLNQFARLLQNPSFDVLGRLSKAKYLDAEDLFYLGFHFAEQNRREKEFGGQVLQLVIQRSPNSARAKDARRKLKSEGLV
jgi:hypothetical protein